MTFNVQGAPITTIEVAELERLQEIAAAAQAVCDRGWIVETAAWLRRAVAELPK